MKLKKSIGNIKSDEADLGRLVANSSVQRNWGIYRMSRWMLRMVTVSCEHQCSEGLR